MSWLTPKRIRAATATLFVCAFAISSVGLSGSTPAAKHPVKPPLSARR